MKVIFVTGKGGVGKTSFASALALNKSQSGHRVLLVEFGPKSYLNYIFSSKAQKNKIKVNHPLEVATWQFEEVLIEFITHFLKFKPLVEKFFSSPIMKKLIKVAPSLRELVYLGKATSSFRNIGKKMDYDFVVIDAYSTGHFLALLRSPAGMMEAVSRGVMHEQCKSILEVMQDPKKVEYYMISLAEKLPIIETEELGQSLQSEFGIKPKIIFNKIKEPLSSVGTSQFETEYEAKNKNQTTHLSSTQITTYAKIPYIYETQADALVLSMVDYLKENNAF